MGGGKGNRQRKSSSFSLFSMFRRSSHRRSAGGDQYWEEATRPGKVYRSDEDRRYWAAEPGIDRRASAFIAKFHESRLSSVVD